MEVFHAAARYCRAIDLTRQWKLKTQADADWFRLTDWNSQPNPARTPSSTNSFIGLLSDVDFHRTLKEFIIEFHYKQRRSHIDSLPPHCSCQLPDKLVNHVAVLPKRSCALRNSFAVLVTGCWQKCIKPKIIIVTLTFVTHPDSEVGILLVFKLSLHSLESPIYDR